MRLDEALKISDEAWYKTLFKAHDLRRLSEEEVAAVISGSMQAAEMLWAKYGDAYAEKGAEGLLDSFGVRVVVQSENPATNLLAFYDLDQNVLRLQSQSVRAFGKRIADAGCGDLVSPEWLAQMVLTHELYHVLEMNEDDIYTYRKLITRKILCFEKKERLPAASEIGAYHFTKLALKPDFPLLFLEEL